MSDQDSTARPTFAQRTVSSLRSRNFRLFFIGQSISNTGNWLTLVALTLLVLHRTGSGISVGVLSACQFGPILVLSAWAGGCLLAFDNPVRRSFVSEMVPVEDVPNAVTLYSAMVNIARIGGPALAGVLIVTVGNFTVVFPLFVEKALHGSDSDYTLVYSAFSVGALVGAFAVARRETVTTRTVTIGAAWLGVSMLVLAAVPSVLLAVVVVLGVGAASVAYLTATTVLAQVVTDPMMMGRVLGLQAVLIVGTTPIGGPFLGAVSDGIGSRWPVVIGGIGALLAAAFGALAARSQAQLSAD